MFLSLCCSSPVLAAERHGADVEPLDTHQWVCVFLYDLAIFLCFGPNALSLSLRVILVFGRRLAPLAARWIQEHFTQDPAQETFDYYGPLNLIALNIGYQRAFMISGRALVTAAAAKADGTGVLRRLKHINRGADCCSNSSRTAIHLYTRSIAAPAGSLVKPASLS